LSLAINNFNFILFTSQNHSFGNYLEAGWFDGVFSGRQPIFLNHSHKITLVNSSNCPTLMQISLVRLQANLNIHPEELVIIQHLALDSCESVIRVLTPLVICEPQMNLKPCLCRAVNGSMISTSFLTYLS
jgi:hypothetical protein